MFIIISLYIFNKIVFFIKMNKVFEGFFLIKFYFERKKF